jgi:hypothetical protein
MTLIEKCKTKPFHRKGREGRKGKLNKLTAEDAEGRREIQKRFVPGQ